MDPVTLCCWFPFIGLAGFLQGLIAVIPVMLFVTLANTFIALLFIPQDIWYTYACILKTSLIGPYLRTMAILLLPIPLLLWPVVVFIGSLLVGLFFGLFGPIGYVISGENIFTGGIEAVFIGSYQIVRDFWKSNCYDYFAFLDDYKRRKLPAAGQPFDVTPFQLVLGLFEAAIGTVLVGLPVALIAVIKFVPALFKMYNLFWEVYWALPTALLCMGFIPFVLANLLLPVFSMLALALIIIGGFGIGTYAAWASYKLGAIGGFEWMWETIKQFDAKSNHFIFENEASSFGPLRDLGLNSDVTPVKAVGKNTAKTKKDRSRKRKPVANK